MSKSGRAPIFLLKLLFALGITILAAFAFNVDNAYACSNCSGGQYSCQNGTMCCTGGGCPSYKCTNYPGYDLGALICNGSWNCCDKGSCSNVCISGALYQSQGTCQTCDGKPGGGGKRPCEGSPSAPRLRSPANGTVFKKHGAVNLDWDTPSYFGNKSCYTRDKRYITTLWYPNGLGSITRRKDPSHGTNWWINTQGFDGEFLWRVTACTYSIEKSAGCRRSATWRFYVNPSSASCSQVTGTSSAPDGGSTSLPIADASGYYNLYARDSDEIEYTTSWSSSCSLIKPTVERVEVNASGSNFGGDWTEMDIVTSDDIGVRSTQCSFTVDSSSTQTYSCDINDEISTLEVVYTNGFSSIGGNRTLTVDNIQYFFADGSTKIIESESNSDSGDKVIYDRSVSDTAFDGNDTSDGTESMTQQGALRFPIPLMFDPATPPATCTAAATVSDDTGTGNTCSLNVDVCGWPGGPASNPNPPVGEENVPIPPTVSWDGPADWGEACGGSRGYTVYSTVRVGGVCPDPGASYTALPTCTDLPDGTTSCSDPFFNIRDTEFCWYVEANNGSYGVNSATTGADVWWFKTEDPILYQNWSTSLFGDFYAGSLISEFPDPLNYVAPWTPPSLSFERNPADPDTTDVATLSSNDISISSSDASEGYSPQSQSNYWAEFASFAETWPPNFTGRPPSDAISLPLGAGSCDNIFIQAGDRLDTTISYEGDVSCIQTAINNTSSSASGYQLANNGVAVVYVTGTGELRITNEFLTDNDSYRIVFVTGPDVQVKIDRSLSLVGDPDWTSTPLVEAAFVVVNSMEFEGVAALPIDQIAADPDGSIVVEGPIVGRNIILSRNRGLGNGYPSEIFQYNNKYIYDMTQQERQSVSGGNYSGLFVIDVDWIQTE